MILRRFLRDSRQVLVVQTFGVYIKIFIKTPTFSSMTSILFYLDSRLELCIYPALELSWHFNCSLARTICVIAHMQCYITGIRERIVSFSHENRTWQEEVRKQNLIIELGMQGICLTTGEQSVPRMDLLLN